MYVVVVVVVAAAAAAAAALQSADGISPRSADEATGSGEKSASN